MSQSDLFSEVTASILKQLESGVAPWVRPWSTLKNAARLLPYNAISGKTYRGINTWLLMDRFAGSNGWLTYKQAQDIGAQVRKGEKGTRIVFWKPFQVRDTNDPDSTARSIPLLRHFTVFNLAQVDGMPEKYTPADLPVTAASDWEAVNKAQSLATIVPGGDRACFVPSKDLIAMPPVESFVTRQEWASTLLHELTHWTGHPSRLAREFGKRFGDSAYAFEELIAEMGSAYLCAHAKVDGQLQHASYLQSWIKILENDSRAILTAASHAQKAADYILTAIGQTAEQDPEESIAA